MKTKQKLYTCTAIQNLIDQYCNADKKAKIITLQEGCLGYGLMVLMCEGYKTAIVKEVPLNCWSSAHTVRFYNKTPKRYLMLIERKEEEYGDN